METFVPNTLIQVYGNRKRAGFFGPGLGNFPRTRLKPVSRRFFRIVSTAALFFAMAAVKGFAQGQTVNLNYKVAGVDRQTILYAPNGLGAKPPLVYVIHGFNMSGKQEVQLRQMNKVADTGKFIVVYPNALKNTSNQQSWDLAGTTDYTYLLSLIDTVSGGENVPLPVRSAFDDLRRL